MPTSYYAAFIATLALLFTIFINVSALNRLSRNDQKIHGAEMATILVKLEAMGLMLSEIKSSMNNLRLDAQEQRERLIVVEQSVKSAHKRLDNIDGQSGE